MLAVVTGIALHNNADSLKLAYATFKSALNEQINYSSKDI